MRIRNLEFGMRNGATKPRLFVMLFALIFLNSAFRTPHSAFAEDFGFARPDGGRPGAFLDFGASARALAMGQAGTAATEDASSLYWNPAALGRVARRDLVSVYSALHEDTGLGSLFYAEPTARHGVYGAGLVDLRSGSFKKTSNTGERQGSFDNSQTAIFLGFGHHLGPVFVGAAGKIIREEIDVYKDTAPGIDLGVSWDLNSKMTFAAAYHNFIAPSLELKDTVEAYSRDLRLGAAWRPREAITLALDLQQTQKQDPKVLLGAEWVVRNLVALRAGLNEREMTAGLGIRIGDGSIDYALGYHNAAADVKDLGASHRVGFRWSFGPRVEREGEPEVKWKEAAEALSVLLQEQMDSADVSHPEAADVKALSEMTQDVIANDGFWRLDELFRAEAITSFLGGNYEKAVEHFGAVVAMNPGNSVDQRNLEMARSKVPAERADAIATSGLSEARQQFADNDFCGAVEACMKVLSFSPNSEEAKTLLDQAREKAVAEVDVEFRAAELLYQRGLYLQALKQVAKVWNMDPYHARAKSLMVMTIDALETEKKTAPAPAREARAVFEVRRDPKQSIELYRLGLRRYAAGRKEEARQTWQKAVEYDRQNRLAQNALYRVTTELKGLKAGDESISFMGVPKTERGVSK